MDESARALLEDVVISAGFGSDLVEEFCARVAKGCYLRNENEADRIVVQTSPNCIDLLQSCIHLAVIL